MLGVITALEIQKRNKERVNVYLDGEYAFSLSLIEAAKLRKGAVLDQENIQLLQQTDTVQRAVDSGARFLANRPRSIEEVRRNLSKKEIADAVIDEAIERLGSMGYLDDEAFARYWLENRSMFKPRGPMALRFELRQKGINEQIIDRVLEDMDVLDEAYRAAQQKATRLRGLSQQQFRNKLGSFLQRRGFKFDTARDVIERIASEMTADDPDFFLESDDDLDI